MTESTEEKNAAEYTQLEDDRPLPALMTKAQVIILNISFFGFNSMYLVLCVEAVPAQMEAMVGTAYKGRWFGGMAAGAAVLMFIAGPLVGMKSDRLVSKFGRRRPVMLVSTILLCICLMGTAFSAPEIIIKRPAEGVDEIGHSIITGNWSVGGKKCTMDLVELRCRPYMNTSIDEMAGNAPVPEGNVPQTAWITHNGNVVIQKQGAYQGNLALFIIFFLLVTICMIGFTVPYNALNADLTHPDQRGFSSGVMGFMILSGNIFGAAIGLFFVQMGVFMVYGCVVVLILACALITVFCTHEPPSEPNDKLPPITCKEIFFGFWAPLKDHDFRWVFITRFLMQQGISTVTGFLQYWLTDMVIIPNCWSSQRGLGIILVPMLVTAAIGSLASGVISDKIKRRKVLVMGGGMLMSAGSLVLSAVHGAHAFYVGIATAFVFGFGFGTYCAVDFALVMDVLPSHKDKAKDLAVWHEALILPQALATPIGGVVLDVFERVNCTIGLGYIMLFIIASIYFILSAALVFKIKNAR